MDLLTELTILVLAAFVGFEVISKVPNTLHTPLMSATNAIHGIVLLGGLLLIGEATGFLDELLLVVAIAFGTINVVGAVGMAIAVVATLLWDFVGDYWLIAVGIALGTAVGIPAARSVKMTAMPQMVALFNGVGGGAVALIAWVEFRESGGDLPTETAIPLVFSAIVGPISFWGSNIAFGKLQEVIPGRPIQLPGQKLLNGALLLLAVGCAVAIAGGSESEGLFIAILV